MPASYWFFYEGQGLVGRQALCFGKEDTMRPVRLILTKTSDMYVTVRTSGFSSPVGTVFIEVMTF